MSKLTRSTIEAGEDCAFIILPCGARAIIDREYVDLPEIRDRRWRSFRAGGNTYVQSGSGRNSVLLHRVVVCPPNDMVVDHINGDTLDNRHQNLRWATRAENLRNRKIGKNNTSGYKGVSWVKSANRWRAKITLNGKVHYLGEFKAASEAHAAYCKASAELHGEFSRVA
jgi:HNH endonuclease/AP2 domain